MITPVVAFVIALTGAQPEEGYWRCDTWKKVACSDTSCNALQPDAYSVIDLHQNLYSRCDDEGCDSYSFTVTESGEFTNLEISGRGLIVRVDAQNRFMEVATLGLVSFVSHGQCAPTEEMLYY